MRKSIFIIKNTYNKAINKLMSTNYCSMILLITVFCLQTPLMCWTASKLFNGR